MPTSGRGRLMVVKNVKVTYCDQCGSDGGTERYVVGFPEGNRRTFDLCISCSTPLRELGESLLDKVGDKGPKKHQQPVYTESELRQRIRKAQKGTVRPRSRA